MPCKCHDFVWTYYTMGSPLFHLYCWVTHFQKHCLDTCSYLVLGGLLQIYTPKCLGQLVLTLPVYRSTIEVSGRGDGWWTHRGGALLRVIHCAQEIWNLAPLNIICYLCITNAWHFHLNLLFLFNWTSCLAHCYFYTIYIFWQNKCAFIWALFMWQYEALLGDLCILYTHYMLFYIFIYFSTLVLHFFVV